MNKDLKGWFEMGFDDSRVSYDRRRCFDKGDEERRVNQKISDAIKRFERQLRTDPQDLLEHGFDPAVLVIFMTIAYLAITKLQDLNKKLEGIKDWLNPSNEW